MHTVAQLIERAALGIGMHVSEEQFEVAQRDAGETRIAAQCHNNGVKQFFSDMRSFAAVAGEGFEFIAQSS